MFAPYESKLAWIFGFFLCIVPHLSGCKKAQKSSTSIENEKEVSEPLRHEDVAKKVLSDTKRMRNLYNVCKKSADQTYAFILKQKKMLKALPANERITKLLSFLDSKDHRLYLFAPGELALYGEKVIPRLMKHLSPQNPIHTRKNAARALGEMGPKACTAVSLLKNLATTDDPQTQRVVKDVLVKLSCTK